MARKSDRESNDPRLPGDDGRANSDAVPGMDTQALERAVAKIVLLGKQVGVSVDQMLELLGSGMTVGELLAYLAARNEEAS